jgi:hypothetical protein
VINDWMPIDFGHRDNVERELALANAERRTQTAAEAHPGRRKEGSMTSGSCTACRRR